MKRLFYSLVFFLLVSLPVLAQNEGISFQGLARNAAGEVLVSQKVSLRLSILLDSESGIVAYVETRQVTTNPQGIFAVVLGDANTLTKSTDFSTINWTPASKFIKVEMDPNAGTNFTVMGTSKLQAVPFAFYAYGVDAENVEGIVPVGSGGTGVASIADLRTSLGVDQVDNTADANKPLSAASQAALATKANTADVTTSLASKVDKVTGKELSTNDYTTEEKAKLAAISGTNTGDQDLSAFATRTQLETKVDKEPGKGLSTNDYTTAEKVKLAAITGNVAGPVGPVGPTGATGPQGPIGLTGPAGATGATGLLSIGNEAGNTPYWNGTQWVVNSSNLYNNGSNLGIGTTSPSEKLEVVGNVKTSGTLTAGAITYPNTAGTNGQVLTSNGLGTASWTTAAAASGVNSVGTISGSSTANGASITAGVLNLAPADATNGGIVTTGNQAFSGGKVFNDNIQVNSVRIGAPGSAGSANTMLGAFSFQYGAPGGNNTGVGTMSLASITNSTNGGSPGGNDNTAVGSNAIRQGQGASNGNRNTAVGSAALTNASDASDNTALGYATLPIATGGANTAVGSNSLAAITSGTNNTAIGYGATVSSGTQTNSTAIGNGAIVAASNTIQLGNTSVTNVKTSGTLTAGAITYPNTAGTNGYYLKTDGTGTASWAAVSGDGVPYTGATGAVNLGAYDLTVNGVKVGKGLANIADNTAVGINTLNAASTSGGGNSAFGYQALQANTTGGSSNSAFGYKALTANTSGYNNTAIGASSLLSNTAGFNNIGIGASSLVFNTEGDYNIGVGAGALQQNKLGNTNIAIGREAGFHLNSYSSGSGTGSGNIFIGYQSGISRNRGSNNTAIGNQSLYSYTVDFYDYSNTAAFGVQSGYNNRTNNNTFLGALTDVDYTINSSITNATAVGYQAKVTASNTIQLGNTDVTNVNTSGSVTANGVKIGRGAGNVSTNTAAGSNALGSNTSGGNNTAVGNGALQTNATGGFNTSVGSDALKMNTGSYNVAVGSNALKNNAGGDSNTAMGFGSNASHTSGSNNASFGTSALASNTGSGNTAIGSSADVYAGISNATAVGFQALAAASNTIQLGNTSVTNVNTSGTLTAGTVTYPNTHGSANQVLSTTGSGTLAWTTPSGGISGTGTQNYVSKYGSGGTSLANSSIFDNGTSVGINTASPGSTFKLDVNGAANFASSIVVQGLSIGVGKNAAQTSNTAVGNGALVNNNDGTNNVAIGFEALNGEVRGSNNVAIGTGAIKINVWGGSNVAIGAGALNDLNGWSGNTAIGTSAGAYLNTANNTLIGFRAGSACCTVNTTNTDNIYIGVETGMNTSGSYNTFIGNSVYNLGSVSNNIILADGQGNIRYRWNGTTNNFTGTVSSSGTQLTSDLRLKSNISRVTNGLSTIMQLNPVHYLKKDSFAATAYTLEENGFIAQEIQKILPFLVKEGVDENKLLSIDYNSLIPILTKAIQEQQTQIEELQSYKNSISSLQKELEEIKKLLKGQEK